MNRSDSEEMAGALLAAGCTEAPSLEAADLVVINTCAIREAAEQKVIGRMGVLERLKAANPALRVVLTGCAVRADNVARLPRRYPAVDLFLRPDEEPELVDRLGLASARRTCSPGLRRLARPRPPPRPSRTRHPSSGSASPSRRPPTTCRPAGRRRSGRGAWRAGAPRRPGCRSSTAATRRAPTASCPSAAARSGAGRSTRSWTRRVRSPSAATARSRCSARTSTRTATTCRRSRASRTIHGQRSLGRRLDLDGRPDIAALLRAIDGLRTADGRPAIPRLRFVTSHPWDLTDRLIEAMAACPSVCEHLHLPVQSGDDAVLRRMGRQYTVDAYLGLVGAAASGDPGHQPDDRRHRRLLRRDGGAVRSDAWTSCARSATTRSSRPPSRRVRARPPRAWPTTSRPPRSAVGSTPCSPSRKRSASSAIERWLGRETEVLVESVQVRRVHDHDRAPMDAAGASVDRSQPREPPRPRGR